jgi:hypothetical protein
MPLQAPPPPPAIVTPAPNAQEAEAALLEAFDYELALPTSPELKGNVALTYRWLRAAATFDPAHELPADPFATGRDRKEAEALRHLLKSRPDRIATELRALPIRTSGTALALWRWGRLQVKAGAFPLALRRLWEDRLLSAGSPLTRGYALRHALCWSLAEQDEERFSSVRSAAGTASEDTIKAFQRLFGMLGGPSPVLRLWTLPGLDYHDLRLDQLGASRIWVCPPEGTALPDLPVGTAWIIPSASADLSERDASLSETLMTEGKALAARLQGAGRSAQLAPSRAAFETLGLTWFPILIDLDAKGNIRAIRMGDAAPDHP